MTDELSLLQRLTDRLGKAGIRYFVTGSIASMYYGESRSTRDIDVVVALRVEDLHVIIEAFPDPEFYVDAEAVCQAIRVRRQFNAIDNTTGMKIDFMCIEPVGHDASRLQRAREVELLPGVRGFVAAPEDVILKKLQYFQAGASDKHLRDIASMLKISGETMDRDYLERWAVDLRVVDEWNSVKSRVGW